MLPIRNLGLQPRNQSPPMVMARQDSNEALRSRAYTAPSQRYSDIKPPPINIDSPDGAKPEELEEKVAGDENRKKSDQLEVPKEEEKGVEGGDRSLGPRATSQQAVRKKHSPRGHSPQYVTAEEGAVNKTCLKVEDIIRKNHVSSWFL